MYINVNNREVNVNVRKWSPLGAYFMLTYMYDACTYVPDVRNGNFLYA